VLAVTSDRDAALPLLESLGNLTSLPIRINRKTDSAWRRVNVYQPVLSLAPSRRRRIGAINHKDFQEVLNLPDGESMN